MSSVRSGFIFQEKDGRQVQIHIDYEFIPLLSTLQGLYDEFPQEEHILIKGDLLDFNSEDIIQGIAILKEFFTNTLTRIEEVQLLAPKTSQVLDYFGFDLGRVMKEIITCYNTGYELNSFKLRVCLDLELIKALDLLEKHGHKLSVYPFLRIARYGSFDSFKWLMNYCERTHQPVNYESVWSEVIAEGNFEKAKWLTEKGTIWSEAVTNAAAIFGKLDILKWLIKKGCPYSLTRLVPDVLKNRHTDILFWFLEELGAVLDSSHFYWPIVYRDFNLIKLLIEKGVPCIMHNLSHNLFLHIARDIEMLDFLKEKGCIFDRSCWIGMMYHGDLLALDWLLKNGCTPSDDFYTIALMEKRIEVLKWGRSHNYPGRLIRPLIFNQTNKETLKCLEWVLQDDKDFNLTESEIHWLYHSVFDAENSPLLMSGISSLLHTRTLPKEFHIPK